MTLAVFQLKLNFFLNMLRRRNTAHHLRSGQPAGQPGTCFSLSSFCQCCGSGSGIRFLFDPWIRDPGGVKKSQDQDPGPGMNNPDHIS
jgi:hypothetical protein